MHITSTELTYLRYRSRLFALSTFLMMGFTALLLVNVRNPFNPVDQAIWQFFVSIRTGWADPLVELFTKSFNTLPDTVYAVTAAALISWKRRDGWAFLTIALSMITAPLMMVGVKNILNRSRPPLFERLIEETSFSFPSGHATGAAALCASIFLALIPLVQRRTRHLLALFLGVLTFAVMCSRLYVGVHWGTDVLAGFCLGTGITCLVYGIFPQALVPAKKAS